MMVQQQGDNDAALFSPNACRQVEERICGAFCGLSREKNEFTEHFAVWQQWQQQMATTMVVPQAAPHTKDDDDICLQPMVSVTSPQLACARLHSEHNVFLSWPAPGCTLSTIYCRHRCGRKVALGDANACLRGSCHKSTCRASNCGATPDRHNPSRSPSVRATLPEALSATSRNARGGAASQSHAT